MKNSLSRWVALAVALTVAVPSWAGLGAIPPGGLPGAVPSSSSPSFSNIVTRLERLGDFSILLAALETADLKDTVATGGPFTLFAPTDRAFAKLLAELETTAPELLADPNLASILLYHVVPGGQRAGELLTSSTATTLSNGQPVLIVREGTQVLVNRARVARANVTASNGVIHVIDDVLLPPEEPVSIQSMVDVLRLDGRFSVLLTALETTGLDDAVAGSGPFTLFAPTDEAFGALLADLEIGADQLLQNPDLSQVLLYHVLGGTEGTFKLLRARAVTTLQGDTLNVRVRRSGLEVEGSRIINPDIKAPNGTIHVIDGVLLPR